MPDTSEVITFLERHILSPVVSTTVDSTVILVAGILFNVLLKVNPLFLSLKSRIEILRRAGFYSIWLVSMVHELSHAVAGILFGGKIVRFSLTPPEVELVFTQRPCVVIGSFPIAMAPAIVSVFLIRFLSDRPVVLILCLPYLAYLGATSKRDILEALKGIPFWIAGVSLIKAGLKLITL
jgi:hypothetical protein